MTPVHSLLNMARDDGDSAIRLLANIRNRTGGWFDCDCGDCIEHGDDFHAWEAFKLRAADAIHYACLYLAERDFEALANSSGAIQ